MKANHKHLTMMPWQGDPRVNIQNAKGRAKAYQVKQMNRFPNLWLLGDSAAHSWFAFRRKCIATWRWKQPRPASA
jgi:hypothetical protein